VKNAAKDKQEITALIKAMESAARTGDLDAAVALVDFPVMMMTDDSKGEAMGEPWSREEWLEVMKPFYEQLMKDMKVTHKPNIFLVSDSLASVDDVSTMKMGGKTITSRNSMFLIRREGKWRVKGMAEGGWGDMMAQAPHGAGSATPGAPSGSEGSTMGTTGSATGTTGSQTTETQAPTGAQPTTK
jgi:ketosteroid isomerase-like protein